VLDPALFVYAGYIGGSGRDVGLGIAVDSSGNAYVTGYTDSADATFPATVGPDLTYNGGSTDAFVAKVNAAGTALVYCGYIGGSDEDVGAGIAVDSSGNAYVTGFTQSTDATFPATVGPDLTYNGGSTDAFVAKVNAAGTALVYCGYLGGAGEDFGYSIAVDSSGNAYVTGQTLSTEATFPVAVGPDLTFNGGSDAFVAKVNAAGTALVYCGYIGGSGFDIGRGIAVDSSGNAYVTGSTASTEATFPVAVGPDLTFNGGASPSDAFVAKVNAAGTALVYCGYIGGSGDDQGYGIAVDSSGNAFVTGSTSSTEVTFPVTVGPDLTYNGGSYDAFVAKVNAAGTALVYCGYIGGSNDDVSYGIAVDSSGNAYVTGYTQSTEATFPVTVGPGLTFNGFTFFGDAFVARVNAAGTALLYCGYIGGSGDDFGYGIAVDRSSNAYVTGSTDSTEATFPAKVGPDLTYNGGANDAFVVKIPCFRCPRVIRFR
jgi:acyl-CoA hydrolase